MRSPLAVACVVVLACALAPRPSRADEGMWTFDNPPLKELQQRYGFTPTAGWLEHVQKSCVNFGGASGSFVSPDGLVLTNHHVALNQLQKMSSAQRDYVRDGFFARTHDEEIACPDLELKVLWSFANVTDSVNAAIDKSAPVERQNAQRKAALARLEQSSTASTGLKTESVELYQGGEYWLYRYRTFKDVRLVCAPEEPIAFFGGDPDNFEFPRHDLDFAIFRIYDKGAPLKPEHWLRWSAGGVNDGDLVFVAGHPGRTERMRTVSQFEWQRDIERPLRIRIQEMRLDAYHAYAARGAEEARQTKSSVRGLDNNLKRERGFLELLREPSFLAQRRADEAALRARVAKDHALTLATGDPWGRIAAAEKLLRTRGRSRQLHDIARVSRLVDFADGIVRLTAEVEKPNDQRFREYRDANLASQRFQLLSRAPVYPAMEEAILGQFLQTERDSLGAGDSFVVAALGSRTPQAVAHDVLSSTKLADVAERKRLLDGGRASVEASTDPLVEWARQRDGSYREERRWYEDNVEGVEALEGAKLAKAHFALEGRSTYPDATGTLRLSYGRAAGYTQLSDAVPWRTTFLGLYDRALSFGDKPPFELPAKVADARGKLDLTTPLNFASTDDIIGGNSGSPVLDRGGDIVGLVFDGNIQSFQWEFGYSDTQARCVSVDTRAIVEALRRIYDMGALANELTGTASP